MKKTLRSITGWKKIWAWSFYDWANSAFALTVMAAFFPGFFKGFWCYGVDAGVSTMRLGIGSAIGGVLVAVLSPVLGALAGAGHNKKGWLALFAITGALASVSLAFIPRGEWVAALIVFIVARTGFFMANLFYDAFLPDVSSKDHSDFVSSLGFGVGYLGCALLFVVNLIAYVNPSLFGIHSKIDAIRISFVSAGVWWLVFSLPILLFVKPVRRPDHKPVAVVVREGITRLVVTFREIAKQREVLLFLAAYWFYIDGVNTVVMMATDFGLSIGLDLGKLMVALLVVQLVAFPSAILFGWLAEHIGGRNAILITIGSYLLITLIGPFAVHTELHFMFFAGLTGAVQGASQALSRSMFARMIPEDRETDWFGVFNMMGRFAVVLGPVIVAASNLFTRHVLGGGGDDLAPRVGVAMISVLFLLGGLLLWRVQDDHAI